MDGLPVRWLLVTLLVMALRTSSPLDQILPDGLRLLSGVGATTTESGEERSLPGALVRDLRVRSVAAPFVQPRQLQLDISWIPPIDNEPPEGYQTPRDYLVTVRLINKTVEACNRHSATFFSRYTEANVSRLLVPEIVQGPMLRVLPECAYNVTVESDPYHGGDIVQTVYLVPKCVDPCQCRPKLPAPAHLAIRQLPNGEHNVTWLLPRATSGAVHHVLLQLGEERFQSNAGLTVYEATWNATVAAPHGHCVVPAHVLQAGRRYRLDALTVDAIGCRGTSAESLHFQELGPSTPAAKPNAPEMGSINMSTMLWLVALGMVTLVAVALAIVAHCRPIRPLPRKRRARPRFSSARKFVKTDSQATFNFPIHQQTNVIYIDQEIEEAKARGYVDNFEISYKRLVLGREIGKGAFGRVFLAQADSIAGVPGFQTVAVKKLHHRATEDEVEEFQSEIAMLKRVGLHPNIVTMLGCCTLKEPYCMLMEYVPCGDLLKYLRELRGEYEREAWRRLRMPDPDPDPAPAHAHAHSASGTSPLPSPAPSTESSPRYIDILSCDSDGSYIQPKSQLGTTSGRPSIPEKTSLLSSEGEPQMPTEKKHRKLQCVLDSRELQNFAVQIARGMAHLETRQITHRDLAARNVLIDVNKTLKISDFGLSRTGVYVNTKRKKVPLRWLSIEAIRENLYSSKSDVWAFAIVLWEIGTLGGFPYPTVEDMNILSFLMGGKRLEKPDNCTDDLYSLMLHCWSYSPDARPSFADLVQHLDTETSRNRVYVDFTTLRPNYTFPPTEQQNLDAISSNRSQQHILPSEKS